MELLHIDASILGDNSVSRQVSAAIVGFRKADPGIEIVYRDLGAAPLPHFTSANLGAANDPVLEEFLAADIVVIGAPMYNFTIPSQLKTWIDRVVIAGKTFRYGPQGVEGLAGNKHVVVAISHGGLYGAGTPAAAAEHVETYLRSIFRFIGVEPEIIVAEGVMIGPEQREKALQEALFAAASLKAA